MVYQLSYSEKKTYLYSALFIAGNIVVPQLCHLIPQGGLILLPIYFFTLVAAYKYGFMAGIMTALCSPLINHLLFGMPPLPMLPILLIKSTLLAVFASLTARRVGRVTFWAVALAVVAYQLVGGIVFEWPMTGSLQNAVQDFCLGYPGIIIQIVFGYLLMKNMK